MAKKKKKESHYKRLVLDTLVAAGIGAGVSYFVTKKLQESEDEKRKAHSDRIETLLQRSEMNMTRALGDGGGEGSRGKSKAEIFDQLEMMFADE